LKSATDPSNVAAADKEGTTNIAGVFKVGRP
jgi:hypothetical protein